jgi:hypothetical protein
VTNVTTIRLPDKWQHEHGRNLCFASMADLINGSRVGSGKKQKKVETLEKMGEKNRRRGGSVICNSHLAYLVGQLSGNG